MENEKATLLATALEYLVRKSRLEPAGADAHSIRITAPVEGVETEVLHITKE